MGIKAVIWDMGGVLLRTEDGEPRSRLGARYGMSYSEIEELVFGSETNRLAESGKIPEREHHLNYLARLGLGEESLEGFLREFFGGDEMDMGLIAFIQSLRPEYKVGLLSNAWESVRGIIEERYGVLQHFDVVVFSAEVKLAKPDQRIYLLTLKELDVQPGEAVFIDDNLNNIAAADELGIHTIHFQNRVQAMAQLGELLNSGKQNTLGI